MLSHFSVHRTALCSCPPSQDNLLIHQIAPQLPTLPTRSLSNSRPRLPGAALPPAYNSPVPVPSSLRTSCETKINRLRIFAANLDHKTCWTGLAGLIIKFYEGGLIPVCYIACGPQHWCAGQVDSCLVTTLSLSLYWSASSLLVSAFKIN